MAALRLCLLGPFEASLKGQALTDFHTKKAQALLIYLTVERQGSHSRESLMTLLWPDMPLESAQVNLRQTVYRLRQTLPEVATADGGQEVPLIVSDRTSIQLNPRAGVRLDLEDFQVALPTDPVRAAEHYRADFLCDFSLADSAPFENWAQVLRQRFRSRALDTLSRLAEEHLQRGEFPQAQAYAWRQIELDSLGEAAYRQLMAALAGRGQRSTALQQYHILSRRLQDELGVEPAAATRQLFEQIQADTAHRPTGPVSTPNSPTGAHMPVFMLTDIEGSTELWDRYRQSMLGALMQHNEILELHIERHGGRILELRGDGVKAVFETGSPLESALAIQKDLAAADWGEIGSLRTRIGLHAVPTVRKDFDYFQEQDKYFGPVLNHTARIMSAGWGGQILVSEQVHHAFPLPPGASWIDHGLHDLRSLDQPVHIFALTHPDLPRRASPPLRTLSNQKKRPPEVTAGAPNNLPAESTPFVGRKTELAELAHLLAEPETRLVTILGPGGMGKTRLALAQGHQYLAKPAENGAGAFPDGVYFLALASLNHFKQIAPEIARVLNIPLEPSPTSENWQREAQSAGRPGEILNNHLASRKMLLILDNFEHLVEGAGIVTELLEHAPGLKILVTSRERLQVRQEQVFPISGLAFPDWETPENLDSYTAIELFRESAHRVRPGFQLDEADGVYLARISRLVEGMPLGLEIAASWVDTLSVKAIAEEIKKSLDFLESDFRDLPDRHRSMRAVFDSTWNRLNGNERAAFASLSIFRAPFNRAAAEEIGQVGLRTLASLVSKSLLQYEGEKGCYQLHEVLRQYGAEQLAGDPETERAARRRHSAFYSQRVDSHMQVFMSGKTQIAIDLLESDFANIRAAWDWALEAGAIEFANQALNGICLYYDWLWQTNDGLAITKEALDLVRRAGDREAPDQAVRKRLETSALTWQGYFSLNFRDNQAAQLLKKSDSCANELIAMGAEAGLEKSLIDYFSGLMHYVAGDSENAIVFIEKSMSISKAKRLHWMTIRSLMALGDIHRYSGALRESKKWYQKALTESRAAGNQRGEISALNNLGWAARNMLDYEEARQFYNEGLELAARYGERWDVSNTYESLGYLAVFLGHFEQAPHYFQQSIAIAEQLGQPYRHLSSWVHIGILKWLSGDFEAAGEELLKTISIASNLPSNARVWPEIAMIEYLTIMARYPEAKERFQSMNSFLQKVFIGRFLDARMPRVLGWMDLVEGDWAGARKHFEISIEMYAQDADDEQMAWSQAGLAAAAIHEGKLDEARQLLTEALWTAVEMQAFIPLLFTLPIVCLFYAQTDPERAAALFAAIQPAAFLQKAPLFHDIAYKFLPDDMIKTAPGGKNGLSENALREHLWSLASRVLSAWMQIWIEASADLPG